MGFVHEAYDVIVIGAGHAGCEAALAAARMGAKTAIFTMNLDSIANMPCNPSIGGTAKGHLVREIDALGGEMGKCADKTLIQSRILNRAKGPAVYSLRAQIDRRSYQREMKHTLECQENLHLCQAEVVDIVIRNNKVEGVITHIGSFFPAKAVVLTTGTYLKGKIIIGDVSYESGPDGLLPSNRLSESLKKYGIQLRRFKTGTPPRINRRSIDFSKMIVQPGDDPIVPFSFETQKIEREQVPCYLIYSTEETHRIVRENLHRSPLYSGKIEGIGPRYCPSFEDKIVKFADKERHQIFVEPMGLDTEEIYLQGFSTSMPEDVQHAMVRSLPGLENAQIMRYAYAIEYDCIDPTCLKLSLEFKDIEGLFSAGQINGSSGYEEAAAQGIIAGINAALKVQGKEPLILDRSQAYIGVLIDDLVTKGTNEPYRMMTSRAEYRLHLRQDNADARLTPIGYKLGLISEERYQRFLEKQKAIEDEIERLKRKIVPPSDEVNEFLDKYNSSRIKSGVKLYDLLKRPEITYDILKEIDRDMPDLPKPVTEEVAIRIKYEGYIAKQMQQIEQFKKMEERLLPEDINYEEIHGLRLEARQKLSKYRPRSLGQASRISGVSPADISVLVIYLNARKGRSDNEG
ncbi:tRNA uridine 5-carboxymethylaminomethyl modification enzyme MnmG [Thermoclostridium stercorarium subsp. stercorarium DSM 8532]|uniref:tRNA uridine 5-carboxymethylaminomethyl modification enzyme MnmG n=2 Tax=Thermoclostridium stercorarium TaxID=1510 RepID=L7VTP1_THES1|nr:tRNA uridine-5-carboxymethylaminomethyl(34) synthesis enzyme MnmG [Thermoclostridium stercorarium]AGC69716.1 tRNA uridine 5-carboxymethylaminomethyl modification enzyme MnmG [Thermoclostridium stercorarium subsp. stercorarium DSM 8532]AGI40666.1 glucose-inhibited division protein A [Thermoclostridium stercorarium subsp. stercorarium DSM 8532]ANW99930.1 tRNA uridine(34) 5-carboxymethylaminomethyl synthesis enzyme MnmG [Thermoclostridium stercorarium subsp. thermolacticum DSM 2910]